MIKASKMSLTCGLFTATPVVDPSTMNEKKMSNTVNSKEPLSFMSGDPTVYGNTEMKMPQEGYDIVKKCILNPKNHSYTASNGTLPARESVAKHYNQSGNGTTTVITGNDVIITHGANMGLFIALMSITNPGDNILVPEPSYPFFHKNAPSVDVEARGYRFDATKNYEIDLEHLATLIDARTRFLWVVNPSNPLGTVYSKQHMSEIMSFCRSHNLFIISDEVYQNASFSSSVFTSFGHIANSDDVPVIVISGVEKTFFVPGWGLSWMIFVDPKKKLNDIKQACLTSCQLYLHPCSFLMAALPELLDTLTMNFAKKHMDIFENNHEYLLEELRDIDGLEPIPSQGTFFLSVKIDLKAFAQFATDIEFLQALHHEENVSILPLSEFYGGFEGFRLQTCANKEMYGKLIPRLNAFCKRHIKMNSSE